MPEDKVKIRIDVDAGKLKTTIEKLIKELRQTGVIGKESFDKLQAELKQTTSAAKQTATGFTKFKKLLTGFAIGGGVLMGISVLKEHVRALTEKVKDWVQAASNEEIALANLAQGLKNVGDASEESREKLVKQAEELERLTGIQHTEILHAQKMLTTFALNSDQIKMLIPQIANMAASFKKLGKADMDMQQISIAVGKAITMGAGALTRYGIVVTDVQKEQLRAAQGMEKIKLITEILRANFDKFAETTGTTTTGMLMKLHAALEDVKESLGHIMLKVLKPLLQKIVPQVYKFVDWLDRNREGIANMFLSWAKSAEIAYNAIKPLFDLFKKAALEAQANMIVAQNTIASYKRLQYIVSELEAGRVPEGARKELETIAATASEEFLRNTARNILNIIEKASYEGFNIAFKKDLKWMLADTDKSLAFWWTKERKRIVDSMKKAREKMQKTAGEISSESKKTAENINKDIDDIVEKVGESAGAIKNTAKDLTNYVLAGWQYIKGVWKPIWEPEKPIELKLQDWEQFSNINETAENLKDNVDNIKNKFSETGNIIKNSFVTPLENLITAMIEKPREMQNSWREFINNIKHELSALFAKLLVQGLLTATTGGTISVLPFGQGGILYNNIIPAAEGLIVNKPTLALIGEKRETNPELITPKRAFTEWLEETFGNINNQDYYIVLDGEKVGKLIKKHEKAYNRLIEHVS